MKQKYISPENYTNERDRIKAYKSVLCREKPTAKRIIKGDYTWRYFAQTSIGTIYFELRQPEISSGEFGETEQAFNLITNILL